MHSIDQTKEIWISRKLFLPLYHKKQGRARKNKTTLKPKKNIWIFEIFFLTLHCKIKTKVKQIKTLHYEKDQQNHRY